MTFRELLDKYRAGQASEEERALVEAELEKSEAIADYLAEQVEDALGGGRDAGPRRRGTAYSEEGKPPPAADGGVGGLHRAGRPAGGFASWSAPWCRPCTISQTPTRWAEWKIARRTLLWRRTAWR